jgi:hypothetical protein
MNRNGICLTTLCAILIFTGVNAIAASSSQTRYACSLDSSGYTAPGTNMPVDVGGVFTMTIAGVRVVRSDATLSVSDGGQGPAVCTYSSGTGSVQANAADSNIQNASISYQPDNQNSSLCPSASASLSFSGSSDGLSFIYTNSDGFIGHGTCGIAGVPSGSTYSCNYTVKNDKGTGAGLGNIKFDPALSLGAKGNTRNAYGVGGETYPGLLCPTFGGGFAIFPLPGKRTSGSWGIFAGAPPGCPVWAFNKIDFTSTTTTILITAPGISAATCVADPAGLQVGSLSADPNPLRFGTQVVNTPSPYMTVTVKNVGKAPTDVSYTLQTGEFDLDESKSCQAGQDLQPGQSCPILVNFTPRRKGVRTQILKIFNIDSEINVLLTGTGS